MKRSEVLREQAKRGGRPPLSTALHNKQRVEQINLMDIDPDKSSPEMLDKIAEHLIQKALAGKSNGMAFPPQRARLGPRG